MFATFEYGFRIHEWNMWCDMLPVLLIITNFCTCVSRKFYGNVYCDCDDIQEFQIQVFFGNIQHGWHDDLIEIQVRFFRWVFQTFSNQLTLSFVGILNRIKTLADLAIFF